MNQKKAGEAEKADSHNPRSPNQKGKDASCQKLQKDCTALGRNEDYYIEEENVYGTGRRR